MFNHPFALELAYIAVEEAVRLGASFADVRYEFTQQEDVQTQNGALHFANTGSTTGIGIRALVRGAWGYAAISEPSRHDAAVAARRAVDLARTAAVLQDAPSELSDHEPHRALYRTPIKRDPLAVPLETKVELLLSIDERLRAQAQVVQAVGRLFAQRKRQIYVSSEGSEIDQELVYTGVGYRAGASDGKDFQWRSFPWSGSGLVMGKGWEFIEELPLLARAAEVAEDVVELLGADPCPAINTDLILGGGQVAAQMLHSLGHLCELDRVLSVDACDSGSFLAAQHLGNLEFASPKVSIYADARQQGGAGTYGFDAEGVPAQRVDLVNEGRFTGYLCGRETARRVGLERSLGSMRASAYHQTPLVRPSNLTLAPGQDGDLEALIADTKAGILMDTPRVFSVNNQGRSFVAQCESAWEIKDGKRVRRLKNAGYQGDTVDFWKSCDAVCDDSVWSLFGTLDYSKGDPIQALPIGLGAAPARFRNVQLGCGLPELPTIADGDPLSSSGEDEGKE